jgi:hypothetical protein
VPIAAATTLIVALAVMHNTPSSSACCTKAANNRDTAMNTIELNDYFHWVYRYRTNTEEFIEIYRCFVMEGMLAVRLQRNAQ